MDFLNINDSDINNSDNKSTYTKMVMDDLYTVLILHPNPWPSDYTKKMKVEFLDKLIEYYTGCEEYERCKDLQKLKMEIINEPLDKIKRYFNK